MASKKLAVVVGVNKYADPTIHELKGAETDAQEVRALLTEHGDFEVADGHFLVGTAATHAAVRGAISDLLWKTDPSAVTLFYFSGHGFQDSYGTGYIAPYDMDKQRPLVHGIEMQGLRRLALRSPNKEAVVLIFDCCYSGIAAEEGTRGPAEATDTAEKCFSDLADVQQDKATATGVFVFSSSAKDETSRELPKCAHKLGKGDPHDHGAFTYHLIEGLMGLAADREGGEISVAMMRKHVDAALRGANQTFKCYESSATNPEGIILARVTDLALLATTLDKIKAKLDSKDLRDVILAAGDLSRVLKDRPNYGPAKELHSKVESGLKTCGQKCLLWIRSNKIELLQQGCRVSDDLEDLVCDLSLGRIEAEHEKKSELMNLLACLLRAVQGNWSVSRLLPFLQVPEPAPQRSPSKLNMGTRGNQ